MTSTALYSIFCALTAAVPSISGIILGRLVTGFLSAIPSAVVAGSIEDLWDTRERIWLVYSWSLASNVGLVLGPVISTSIAIRLGWYGVRRLSHFGVDNR